MSTQPSQSPRIVFGPFEYDSTAGEVRKHGTRLRLRGQPLQILSVLIEQPGALITRDELQQRLWNGTTFVDFEHGLNAAINKLRQLLGDSAEQPRYIETIPGRGYRFIAVVDEATPKAVLELTPRIASLVEIPRPSPFKPWLPWVLSGSLLLAAASGYWLGTMSIPRQALAKPLTFTVSTPTGFFLQGGNTHQTFALSPDGTRLAFIGLDSGRAGTIFLRDFNALDSRALPNTAGVYGLFWAPDGASLFATIRGKLHRFPPDGNAHHVLGDAPPLFNNGILLRPDTLLFYAGKLNYLMPSSGGSPQPGKESYGWPQLLPDGEHILYVEPDRRSGRWRARAIRFPDISTVKDLFETDSRVLYTESAVKPHTGYLLYVRAGNLLAQPFDPKSLQTNGNPQPIAAPVYSFLPVGGGDFSVSDHGVIAYQKYLSRSQLVWVDRRGQVIANLGPANVNLLEGRLSPDETKIATGIYDVERGARDIWVIDSKAGSARRVIVGPGLVDAPVWSPDSRRLAFMRSVPWDLPKLFIRGVDEDAPETSIPSDGFQLPTDWSGDGRFVVFTKTGWPRYGNEGQSDVLLVDLERKNAVVPILHTPFNEENGSFSPDGKWLAFTSDESGQPEVYLQAFQGADSPAVVGARYVVSNHGAQCLRWRPDGKEIFYLGGDGKIYAVSVTLGATPRFGPTTALFTIPSEARIAIHAVPGFDVSHDGQRFIVPSVTSPGGASIVVKQNWETAPAPK